MNKILVSLFLIIIMLMDASVEKYANEMVFLEYYNEQKIGFELMTQKLAVPTAGGQYHKYTIRYELNGGYNDRQNKTKIENKDFPLMLYVPSREGYNFAGWYADRNFQNRIFMLEGLNYPKVVLYAKWTKKINSYENVADYSYNLFNRYMFTAKKLSDCEYTFLGSYKIPGMPSTRELDFLEKKITDISLCPQGLAFSKGYLFVSGYNTAKEGNPGCIHIFDRRSGEYLVSIGMKPKSHLGGLAFDGDNLWVCHSDNNTLEKIPYTYLDTLAKSKLRTVINSKTGFDEFKVSNKPSCITYYDDRIWVATHSVLFQSKMMSYRITDDGLKKDKTYRIPSKVQGVGFDGKGNIYFSTSYGRKSSSYLQVFTTLKNLEKNPDKPYRMVEMPPCSQELSIDGNAVYLLFESASQKYLEGIDGKGTSIAPIDEILKIQLRSVYTLK